MVLAFVVGSGFIFLCFKDEDIDNNRNNLNLPTNDTKCIQTHKKKSSSSHLNFSTNYTNCIPTYGQSLDIIHKLDNICEQLSVYPNYSDSDEDFRTRRQVPIWSK